ncbi:hypothetical protein [Catenuloplanes atrovinosus]|uniref:Uncharacterized protein n=1 Tax=Catenuloplanes atrovinosus TaxID=137266 RepID=A0AAE3YXI1_9ACTN|nr:hypothetical protein [Catenuloplanes atrovinosus]MDR7279741.1 hypothetical protein [Catenuloplanes atrovinosus]
MYGASSPAAPVSGGAPVTSGPPAFRAASPSSYGLPSTTAAPAPVQPDYSLPAQRSGGSGASEPTRARASVPGLNRITPGAEGIVGSATSGTGYPRVYRAGAPGATEPDPVEPPEPAEPPQPPEPPQPAEPPAPGPGPVPTPFPDPNRPGPAPGPQPGRPVPVPPAPPAPPPGPPMPSPMPPFPPPPATGTTWSSASAATAPGRGAEDVPVASLPPWPASEVAQPGRQWPASEAAQPGRQWPAPETSGRQWPPRDGDAGVTPVVRGFSDRGDDAHGVATSAEYNQWARGQRRESGTVYSAPARRAEPNTGGVPANPAIETTGSLTGQILSPQRWNDNSESGNSARVMVIFASVFGGIVIVGIVASIILGDLVMGLFGK